MRKFLQSSLVIVLAISVTSGVAYAMQPTTQVHTEKSIVASIEAPNKDVTAEAEQEPIVDVPVAPAAPTTVVSEPAPAPVAVDNETTTWNFLIANGFTRNQTAGIMGNLQQEHGFKTDGDGLAQWINGRKANLYAKADPTNINTQLAFLMEELNGPYYSVQAQIKTQDNLYYATMTFQNMYEKCDPNYCMFGQRLLYAQQILAKH